LANKPRTSSLVVDQGMNNMGLKERRKGVKGVD
jgi:hypothetical protein